MAPAVITKAQQQELAAVMVPLLRKQLTADVLKAAKLSPHPAPKTRAKSTTTSRDIPIELLERMIRVEEELKLVHVEINHLRADTNLLRKDFMGQIDRIDKRLEHIENTSNKSLNSMRWFMGIIFVATASLITVYQFLN